MTRPLPEPSPLTQPYNEPDSPTREELNQFFEYLAPEILPLIKARLEHGTDPWALNLVGTAGLEGSLIGALTDLQRLQDPVPVLAGTYASGFEAGYRFALWRAQTGS